MVFIGRLGVGLQVLIGGRPSGHGGSPTPFVRSLLASAVLVVALVACNGGNQPPAGGGPEFVINSPVAGSLTAGTFFLSIQPLDPSAVASVAFGAGGISLGTDSQGNDGYRTFVTAADHPAGALVLTATVTGKDGRVRSASVTVTNVPNPPSSATVGEQGAALGTLEADGSLSTLIVPPGTAPGATVSLAARTKEQVRLGTGVDYDALGVAFLGAQEIVTDADFTRPLAVTSGGFGPLVQPGQVVVNYMIGPDADGDGIGELVVVNTASVAPNGDVVSDPVPVVQVGQSASATQQGTLRHLQLGDGLSGPPGTIVEIPVSGFNPASPFGSIARFERAGQVTELVGTLVTSAAGAQTFVTIIPPLQAGAGTLTLLNLGSGYASDQIPVSVLAAPAVQGDPAEAILAVVDAMLGYTDALASVPGTALSEESDRVRAMGESLAALMSDLVAEFQDPQNSLGDESLRVFASLLQVAGSKASFDALRQELEAGGVRLAQAGGPCNDALDRADKSFNAISNGSSVMDAYGKNPSGFIQSWMIGNWWDAMKNAARNIVSATGAEPCEPPPPPPPGPGGSMSPSGMGSTPPPGGPIGGGAWSGGSLYLRSDPLSRYGVAPQQAGDGYREQPGRFVIKVAAVGGNTPFSGATDAGGYFFVPFVPAGEPFTATAIDTSTGDLRTYQGIGPQVGASLLISFDFTAGATATTYIAWDGGGDGSSWHDPLNWDKDRVPLPSDEVTIDAVDADVLIDIFNLDTETVRALRLLQGRLTVAEGTLQLLQASTVDATLRLAGGDLRLEGDLTVNGMLDWRAGTVRGPGLVANQGEVLLTALIGVRQLDGGGLVNSGTVTVTGQDLGGSFRLGNGVVFDNQPGAVFELQGDVTVGHASGGERPVFNNRGLIHKSAGTAEVSDFLAVLHNPGGEIRVDSGTIWFTYGGSFEGATIEVATGATVDLGLYQGYGTTFTDVAGTLSGSGAGEVRLVGGHFVVAADGATIDFPNGSVVWRSANVEGVGALRNEGVLVIAQTVGGSTRELRTTLVNAGTVRMIEVGSNVGLRVGQVAAFENLAGALFDFQSDMDILNNLDLGDDEGPVPFTNAGSLVKSAGAGVSVLEVCYEEEGDGSVEELSGTFSFQCE